MSAIPEGACRMGLRLEADGEKVGEPLDVVVASYRAPGEAEAKRLFERAVDGFEEVSVWRATTSERREWFLHVCGTPGVVEEVGAELVAAGCEGVVVLEPGAAWSLVLRRFVPIIEAIRSGQEGRFSTRTRFGRGAVLRSGGRFELVKTYG